MRKIAELYRVTSAARMAGMAATTLATAIERGEIPVERTACGLALVALPDIVKWAKKDRPVGRPRKDR